jgi:hypothetical protein
VKTFKVKSCWDGLKPELTLAFSHGPPQVGSRWLATALKPLSLFHGLFNLAPEPQGVPKILDQPHSTCSRTRASSNSSTRSARSGVTVTGMS